LKHLNLGNI